MPRNGRRDIRASITVSPGDDGGRFLSWLAVPVCHISGFRVIDDLQIR